MPRLDDAIWARITELDPLARNIAELVALLGVPAPIEVFREASQLTANGVRRALATLRASMLIRTVGAEDSIVEPYHDSVREAVIARLDRKTRRARHEQLIDGLRACGIDRTRPELLIDQLEAVGDYQPAARHAVEAADRALAGAAFDRAAELFARAIKLGDFRADELLRLQRAWADALAGAGRTAASATAYLGAAELVTGTHRLELRARAGAQLMRGGRFDEGMQLADEVLRTIGVPRPRTTNAVIWRILRDRARLWVRLRSVRPHAVADVSQTMRMNLDTLWGLGSTLSMFDTLLGTYFKNLQLLSALRGGSADDIACGLAMEAGYCAMSHKTHHRARRCLEMARALSPGVDQPSVAWLHAAEGLLRMHQGDWSNALVSFDHSFETSRREGSSMPFEISAAESFWLWTVFWSGDYGSLRARHRSAMRAAEASGDTYLRKLLSIGLCNAAWLVGDQPELARSENDDAIEPWRGGDWRLPHYWHVLSKLNIALYTGAAEEAGGAAELLRRLPAWMLSIDLVESEATHAMARGLLAAAKHADDARALSRVDRMARKLSRRPIFAAPLFSSLLWAGTAAVRGDPAARQHLERAVAAAAELGIMGYKAAAQWALGVVIGGADGERIEREGLAELERLGARDPMRMARMLVPGIG